MIKICDTTLRDAKYTPRVFYSEEEQLHIASFLNEIGVDEAELGIPNFSQKEFNTILKINKRKNKFQSSALFFCTKKNKIEDSILKIIDCGCNAVCISIPVSENFVKKKLGRTLKGAMTLMEQAVDFAVRNGLYTIFSGEDASRANVVFLKEYIKLGETIGASRFRFSESVSFLEPSSVGKYFEEIKRDIKIDLEIHSHTAFGLGLANCISAFYNGAN